MRDLLLAFNLEPKALLRQDTYLLATQQAPTLTAELDLARQAGLLPGSPAAPQLQVRHRVWGLADVVA